VDDGSCCACFRGQNLRSIAPELYLPLSAVASLDLSNNELAALPGLACLGATLRKLNLSRNWFKDLPPELAELRELSSLDASRNFLRSNAASLRLRELAALPKLRLLDLSHNRKCGRRATAAMLECVLPGVRVRLTITQIGSAAPGTFVGNAPSDRDAALLRSQLEPWGTLILRRRLEEDFGQSPTDPTAVPRAEVMRQLLACYAAEGLGNERAVARLAGKAVSVGLREKLLAELRQWAGQWKTYHRNQQERPSIKAEHYMILRSPSEYGEKHAAGSRKARLAATKNENNARLWRLACAAMTEVDPEFARRFTAIAVTRGFTGSPHIDKQNIGPFYGLALGTFAEGQGGLRVECGARQVAEVNTRNRLGKVDGRFPHWVAPYEVGAERYSLIYYQTEGEAYPLPTDLLAELRAWNTG
jgi:hypothetical protein